MPAYNSEGTVSRSVSAILDQSYRNLELIVVDDGSTDNTLEVVRGFSDRRLRLIKHDANAGVGAARQTGVQNAGGALIAFADADDLWYPEKLSLQVEFLTDNEDIEFLFGDFLNRNEMDGTEDRAFHQCHAAMNTLLCVDLGGGWWRVADRLPEALLKQNFIGAPSVVVSRSLTERVGGINPSLRYAADFEFAMRCAMDGAGFAYSENPLFLRVKSGRSVTATGGDFAIWYERALERCSDVAREYGRNDLLTPIRRACRRVWRGQVLAAAKTGDFRAAMASWRRSLRYGVSLRAGLFLVAAVVGPGNAMKIRWLARSLGAKG